MHSRLSLALVSILAVLIVVGMLVIVPVNQRAVAATNAAFSFHDLTDPGNPRYGHHLYVFTQSTASPETFSVALPEFGPYGISNYDYDRFLITYQSSSVTGEWVIENTYIWVDTDGDAYPQSLQATLTGADANSPVYVDAFDYYGE